MKTPARKTTRRPPADSTTLCADDMMQRKLITVRASDELREVERVLAEAHISGAPVLDEDDHVLGVISMSDLIGRHVDDGARPDDAAYPSYDDDESEQVAFRRAVANEACAGDLMTTDIASVGPAATLVEVANKMVDAEVHRLLVLDTRGRVVGIITTMDVLRAIAGRVPGGA
ncbi:MAG TPA: CBS domain-containing protein [Planctomycetota bacterium]|nr:CBS domain-containing protein [Planctomycetota bacterium]